MKSHLSVVAATVSLLVVASAAMAADPPKPPQIPAAAAAAPPTALVGTVPVKAPEAAAWPLKDRNEIRAMHGPSSAGMQILTYSHTVAPRIVGTAPVTIVGIGTDSFYVEQDGSRVAYDLKLGRVFSVRRDGTYSSWAMEAVVADRVNDRVSRLVPGRVLTQVPDVRDSWQRTRNRADTFWASAETHVIGKRDPRTEVEVTQDGDDMVFTRQGITAVRWSGGASLPPQVASTMSRVLPWVFSIHPGIVDRISGSVPSRLEVTLPRDDGFQTNKWSLTSSAWCADCEALPSTSRPEQFTARDRDVFQALMWPLMVAAARGQVPIVPQQEYLRRIKETVDRNKRVESILWVLEMGMQDARPPCMPDDRSDMCKVLRLVDTKARDDVEVVAMRKAMADPCRIGDCMAPFAGYRWQGSPNSYMVELFAAAKYPVRPWVGSPAAERLYASALRSVSMLPSVYRDIGDYYLGRTDPLTAWTTWDMGQAIPGRAADPGLWDGVHDLSHLIRSEHPYLF